MIRNDPNPSPQGGTSIWYSGIDQHKQFSVITTYGPEGPRVKQARVASTPLALETYSRSSRARTRRSSDPPAAGTGSRIPTTPSVWSSSWRTPRG